MKLCVLLTTMHQKDFSKFYEMNIQSDCIIANQCDRNEIVETEINSYRVKLVSTDSRGLSRNRNIALSHSYQDADYIMFSDDDLCFYDNYKQLIEEEFLNHPKVDAIKFNINEIKNDGRTRMSKIHKFKKATRREVASTGVWGLVIKKETLIKKHLFFDEEFGAGTPVYCGEDTIFLQEIVNKRIKFFFSPKTIADINQIDSTWFDGYNRKHYIVGGMVFQRMYPSIAWLLVIRTAWRRYKRHESNLSFFEILCCYKKGIKNYKKGIVDFE